MGDTESYIAYRARRRRVNIVWWLCMAGGVWGFITHNPYGATWAFIAAIWVRRYNDLRIR